MAAMAPARSTRCITLPPSTLPSPLASLGSASSEYSEIDSPTVLPCVMLSRYHAKLAPDRHRPRPEGPRLGWPRGRISTLEDWVGRNQENRRRKPETTKKPRKTGAFLVETVFCEPLFRASSNYFFFFGAAFFFAAFLAALFID